MTALKSAESKFIQRVNRVGFLSPVLSVKGVASGDMLPQQSDEAIVPNLHLLDHYNSERIPTADRLRAAIDIFANKL